MKKIKKITALLLALACLVLFSSCGSKEETEPTSDTANIVNTADVTAAIASLEAPDINEVDNTQSFDISSASTIVFSGTTATVSGGGVTSSGGDAKISKAGVYAVSGTAQNNSIIVDAGDDDVVVIVLNNASITSNTSSAIYVKNAGKVVVNSPEGTNNTLVDAAEYSGQTDGEPDSTIYSKDDLTINGGGTLNVTANYNDAIKSNDTLIITGSTINITSVDDGIVGKDFVVISGGTFNVNAGGDAIKSTYDTDTTKGEVSITGGSFNLVCGADGIQAHTRIKIDSGNFTITSGGGSSNAAQKAQETPNGMFARDSVDTAESTAEAQSCKGIKCSYSVEINGGSFNINSADDTLHCNNTISIKDGSLTLSSGDDGIHSDTTLNISGGDINITGSYEGIESAEINISGGTIHIVASDDGINAAGGNDSSNSSGVRGGDPFASSTGTVNITGGYIYMNASGDGLDSNGAVYMSAGTVLIDGPTNSGNGALDYTTTFKMTGGTLIAAGASGMAQTISTSSSVYSVSVGTGGSSGTVIRVLDENNNEVIAFAPSKSFSNVVIASESISKGKTYTVTAASLSSGTKNDGVVSNGSYTSEKTVGTFTASSVCSSVGNASTSGGMMGGGGGGMMRR